MKKLEAKRKDREKRAQDLQRLINTSERSSVEPEALVNFIIMYNFFLFRNGLISSTQLKNEKRRAQKKAQNVTTTNLFSVRRFSKCFFSIYLILD